MPLARVQDNLSIPLRSVKTVGGVRASRLRHSTLSVVASEERLCLHRSRFDSVVPGGEEVTDRFGESETMMTRLPWRMLVRSITVVLSGVVLSQPAQAPGLAIPHERSHCVIPNSRPVCKDDLDLGAVSLKSESERHGTTWCRAVTISQTKTSRAAYRPR
jgi:hypothetical protein